MVGPSAVDRPEPRGMSLADLVSLVVGVALACALPTVIGQRFWYEVVKGYPAFIVANIYLCEFARKLLIALMPVILARRWRFGGRGRPAEWLILAFAAVGLAWFLWPYLLRKHLDPYFGYRIVTALFPIAASLFLFVQRRNWARRAIVPIGFVALVTWFGGPAMFIAEFLGRIWWWFHSEGHEYGAFGPTIYRGLVLMPYSLVLDLFLAAVVADRLRVDSPRWSWVEWLGAVCAGTALASRFITDMHWTIRVEPAPVAVAAIAIRAIESGATLALAWWLLRRLGPAWNRPSGVGYDGFGPASPYPEA